MLTPEHETQIAILINEMADRDSDNELYDDLHLFDDLGFDSLDAADLAVQLEQWALDLNPQADISSLDAEWPEWTTVGNIYSTMEKIL